MDSQIPDSSSPRLLRRLNAERLLAFVWDRGPFTASEAMAGTGLTRSTVLTLCDELIQLRWLRELEDARVIGDYTKGRPARRYTLDPDAGALVGVDAGRHAVTATVADLRGRELGQSLRTLSGDDDGNTRLRVVAEVVDEALAAAGVSPTEVLVAVVGVPAKVDAQGMSAGGHKDKGFWERMNPGFGPHFRDRGWVTVIENDANLAAHAEGALGAATHCGSYAALLAGERFGAGLVVNGVLLRGRHGGAGEMLLLDLVEGVGDSHGIGALARIWGRAARAAGALPAESPLNAIALAQIDAPAVFAAATVGDPAALAIVERLGDVLARVCAVIHGLLDVERIVVCGGVAVAAEEVLAEARLRLVDLVHTPGPELVASPLGAAVVRVGAVSRAVAHVQATALDLKLPEPLGVGRLSG